MYPPTEKNKHNQNCQVLEVDSLIFVAPHVSALPGGVEQWKECLVRSQKFWVLGLLLPVTA